MRDYEKIITEYNERVRTTQSLLLALRGYIEVIHVDLQNPDEFTIPSLLGMLFLQEEQIMKAIGHLQDEWEKEKRR